MRQIVNLTPQLSRVEAESFLDRNNARLPYTREMLEADRRNLAEIFGTR